MASDDKHTGLRGAVDRAQDMVGGMVGQFQAGMASATASGFVTEASLGNLYEIAAATVALQRCRSEEVRQVARRMLEDHTAANHQLHSTLRALAHAPVPPSHLDMRRSQMIEHLRKAADEDFDGRYLEQQEMAHKETLTLFKGFADGGDEPTLRRLAQDMVPVLERHLEHVQAAIRH